MHSLVDEIERERETIGVLAGNLDLNANSSPLKFIDLFAGLGGFHVALDNLGMECVFASELDKTLREIYTNNFFKDYTNPPVRGDVHEIEAAHIPTHDFLCAGFPCQPFSQAGKRQGLSDKANGNHFLKILEILEYHRPKFFLLENVPNLKGHDKGRTWSRIHRELSNDYEVNYDIISPVQVGVPHSRKRVFIFGILKNENINVTFPKFNPGIIEPTFDQVRQDGLDGTTISAKHSKYISFWQEFAEKIPDGDMPGFPIWATEFGATYPFENSTPHSIIEHELIKYKGSFGRPIRSKDDKATIPKYALTEQARFPRWKVNYIRKNREFYEKHRSWINPMLSRLENAELSFQKFEWNCGNAASRSFKDKVLQFRPSGLRVRHGNHAPTLVLISTQIPIVYDYISSNYRRINFEEGKSLQSLESLMTLPNTPKVLSALGNAVNSKVVELLTKNVILAHTQSPKI